MAHGPTHLRNKQDFMNRLYESSVYKRALAAARSDDERRRVAAAATDFVGTFADVLVPLIAQARTDTALVQELSLAIDARQQVVTSDGITPSGSFG